VHMSPIPRGPYVIWMSLRAPCGIGAQLLPTRIVQSRRSPTRIIADLELPRAAELRRALAQTFQIQRRDRGSTGARGRCMRQRQ